MSEQNTVHRRDFVKTAAVTGAALGAVGAIPASAQDKSEIKVALIGCGGRGTGALKNHIDACAHLGLKATVVGVCDAIKEKAVNTGKQYGLSEDRCFGGFNGYKELVKTDADVVLIATSPNFRPTHFEAAVNAGKHVFMEKPVAVDPVGARKVIAVGEQAAKAGLTVVAGTQRRHERSYRRNHAAVKAGAIGAIKGGVVNWNQGQLWYKDRNPGEDDATYLVRNWVSFTEMSGDHIVEQHVHNIDVAIWFLGRVPQSAVGAGARVRRRTGNQFDFFNVDFDFGEGVHIHSMCRQINGCFNRVNEFFIGTEGSVWGGGKLEGKAVEVPDFPEHKGPYVQEHVDMLNSMLKKGDHWNQAREVAESTLAAIMGRIASYTGQLVKWEDLTTNEKSPFYNLTLSPTAADFEAGTAKAPADEQAAKQGSA